MRFSVRQFREASRGDAGLKFNLGMAILFAQTAGWGALILGSVAIGLKQLSIDDVSRAKLEKTLSKSKSMESVAKLFLDPKAGRILTQASLLMGTAFYSAIHAIDWGAVAAGNTHEGARAALVVTGFVSGLSHTVQAPFMSEPVQTTYSRIKESITGRKWKPSDLQRKAGLAGAEIGLATGMAFIGVNAGLPASLAFGMAAVGATVSVRRAMRTIDDPRNNFGAYFWAYGPSMVTASTMILSSLLSSDLLHYGLNPTTWLRSDPNYLNALSRILIIGGFYDLVHDTINANSKKIPGFSFLTWAQNDPILKWPTRGLTEIARRLRIKTHAA